MTKMTRKLFIEEAREGRVQIDEDTWYFAAKVNLENFDMNEMLVDQLKREGLYDNSYVSAVLWSENKPGMSNLPVYGDPKYGSIDKYVTKHLYRNFEDCVMKDLQDRSYRILPRIKALRGIK